MNPADSKHFVIINQYASTPETGIGGRHFQFARALAAMGHRVDLVMAGSHHLLRTTRKMTRSYEIDEQDGFRILYLRTLQNAGAHTLKRVMNWLLFARLVARLGSVIDSRPDAILVSSPSLFAYLGAERLAGRWRTRLCLEVRDIWPLSLIELGGYSPNHPLIRIMQWIEGRAYRKAEVVISNLPGAAEHMQKRGMDPRKFAWIPNGVVETRQPPEPLPPHIATCLRRDRFTIGYAGTLGLANSLDTILEAAALLRSHSDIAFIIVGDGRERTRLEQYSAKLGLDSVVFVGYIPHRQIPTVLCSFDACYIGWRRSDLYRFGIAANKIPEYMFAAKPILHGYSGRNDPIAAAGCGITVPAGNARALADAILQLRSMSPSQRRLLGNRGKVYADAFYAYSKNVEALARLLGGSLPCRATQAGSYNSGNSIPSG